MPTRPTTSETFCACVDEPEPEIGDAPVDPEAADVLADWTDDAEPDTAVEPDAAATFLPWPDAEAAETTTPPEAVETFAACALEPLPCDTFPIAPDALDTFGDCAPDAAPLTATAPAEAPTFFCCVDALVPLISARPEAIDELFA